MTDLTAAANAIKAETADKLDRAEQARAAAAEAEAGAAAAAEAAHRAELQALKGSNRPLTAVMSEIGANIDTARQQAIDAVGAGDDPAGAWVRYRLKAADELGRWEAFANQYRMISGRNAPQGPGHRLPPLPGPGANPPNVEGFTEFLLAALRKIEPQRTSEARQAADTEISTPTP